MKKVIIVALLALSVTGFAQEGKKKKGPEQSTEMRLKKLTEELTLTADQQKQMASVIEEQAALKKSNQDNQEANKGKMNELSQKVKGILTPEQFEKWKANKEHKKHGPKDGHKKEPKTTEKQE